MSLRIDNPNVTLGPFDLTPWVTHAEVRVEHPIDEMEWNDGKLRSVNERYSWSVRLGLGRPVPQDLETAVEALMRPPLGVGTGKARIDVSAPPDGRRVCGDVLIHSNDAFKHWLLGSGPLTVDPE